MDNLIKFETKAYEVKELDNGNLGFTAVATSFGNPDVVDDIIVEGALDNFLQDGGMPKLLWGHDAGRPPIGKINNMYKEGDKVMMVAEVFKSNRFAIDEVIPGMKEGVIDSVSIGFSYNPDMVEFKNGFRLFKEITLHEVSVVNFPANPKARITNVKSLNGFELNIAEKGYELHDDSNENVKSFAEESKIEFKDAFLDEDCKVQFIDVVEEKAVVVSSVVEKAMLSLKGIIKEFEFAESEIEEVKYKIARAYKVMGKANPFEDGFKLSESEVAILNNERELEKALKSTGMFTKEAAKTIASNFKFVDRDDEQADDQRDAEESENNEEVNQEQLEQEQKAKEAIDAIDNFIKTLK